MTPDQFKAARKALSLSQRQLAGVWSMGQNGERTIRRWEQGDTPVNPIAAYCIQMMLEKTSQLTLTDTGPDGMRKYVGIGVRSLDDTTST